MDAALSKFRNLIRLSARWLFSGDLSERIQEEGDMDGAQPDTSTMKKPKRKSKQVSEKDLAVIIIDTLSYHKDWVSEDKFAEKIKLGAKQVRRMMQFLQRQGFVVREHRREKKQGSKVESVAEYDDPVSQARTATYVCIDFPHFFDMIRLRIHLAKKLASDKIDDGSTIERYACCSRDGMQPFCGQQYDTFGILELEADDKGFFKCATCDHGIIAPDDALSRTEPHGERRIMRMRLRRENAKFQKAALLKALRPLEDLIARLAGVVPPDFGSFTDWAQARQEALLAGKAQAATGGGGRGGTSKGRLDYGIDGPVHGVAQFDVDVGGGGDGADGAPARQTIALDAVQADARESLPYFMQQQLDAAGPVQALGADVAPVAAESQAADEERAKQEAYYAAFKAQYEAQVAAMQAAQAAGASALVKPDPEGGPPESGVAKRERDGDGGNEEGSKRIKPDDGAVDEGGFEWEDAAATPQPSGAAAVGQEEGQDLEWEDA